MNQTELKNLTSSVYVESDNIVINNPTLDKDVIIYVNDGGTKSEVARFIGASHTLEVYTGASGSFTTVDSKTVTVIKGIITTISI